MNWETAQDVGWVVFWLVGYGTLWFLFIKPYVIDHLILVKLFSLFKEKHNKAKMMVQILGGMIYWTAIIPLGALLILWYDLWANFYVKSSAIALAIPIFAGLLVQANYGIKVMASLDLFMLDAYEVGENIDIVKKYGDTIHGLVTKIHWRGTVLDSPELGKITVPNDKMLEYEIYNWDANNWRYETIKLKLDPGVMNLSHWRDVAFEIINDIDGEFKKEKADFTAQDRSWYQPPDDQVWTEAIEPQVNFDIDKESQFWMKVRVPVTDYETGQKFRSEFTVTLAGYRDKEGLPFPRAGLPVSTQMQLQQQV